MWDKEEIEVDGIVIHLAWFEDWHLRCCLVLLVINTAACMADFEKESEGNKYIEMFLPACQPFPSQVVPSVSLDRKCMKNLTAVAKPSAHTEQAVNMCCVIYLG